MVHVVLFMTRGGWWCRGRRCDGRGRRGRGRGRGDWRIVIVAIARVTSIRISSARMVT